MIGLYVYFHSAADDAAVLAALRRAGTRLAADGWPPPGLWRRPGRDGARATWMQVHAPQPAPRADALAAAIDTAIDASGLAALIDGTRHVERFESCE